MDYLRLREHQPILFDIKGDLNDIWKIQGAARLIGTTVRTFGVIGVDAVDALMDVKMAIRDRFAVPCEFDREKTDELSQLHARRRRYGASRTGY